MRLAWSWRALTRCKHACWFLPRSCHCMWAALAQQIPLNELQRKMAWQSFTESAHQSNINLIFCSHPTLSGSIYTRCSHRKKKSMNLYILQLSCVDRNICRKSMTSLVTEMWKYMFLILHCKGILEELYLHAHFSVFRLSVPSPAVTAAANLHTLRSPSCRHPRSPLTWTMGTPNPTTATATGTGTEMEPGTLSTTTQQGFMLTTALMGIDPCQVRWEASASVLHTGEGGTFSLIFILTTS